jgi:hypothetical protein
VREAPAIQAEIRGVTACGRKDRDPARFLPRVLPAKGVLSLLRKARVSKQNHPAGWPRLLMARQGLLLGACFASRDPVSDTLCLALLVLFALIPWLRRNC